MENIGLYRQLTGFTTEHAGTAEWCKAERDGKTWFVKKFQSPVYPSREIGLPDSMYQSGVREFHRAFGAKQEIYRKLREHNGSGILTVPDEVFSYQFHICTAAEFVHGNIPPEQICTLSEWQRLALMRTLTLGVMRIHQAGIVHSDLKPDNVLVSQDEEGRCRLRIIDFDGSFPEDDPPEDPEDVTGDPAYFAPEAYRQYMDESVRLDRRMDIFALGIILHYFWTGRNPEKPKDQTIGECLLNGGTVTIDPSVPPALRRVIGKMITADPGERISLHSVYDVLGIQLGLYPVKLVKIAKPEPPKPAASGAAAAAKKREAEIRVDFMTDSGELLRYRTLKVPHGAEKEIEAEEIKGYSVIGPKTIRVKGDADARPGKEIRFTYRKTAEAEAPRKRKGLKMLLAVAALYLAGMFLFVQTQMARGNYASARTGMDLLPFYRELFPEDYERAAANAAETIEAAGTGAYGRK